MNRWCQKKTGQKWKRTKSEKLEGGGRHKDSWEQNICLLVSLFLQRKGGGRIKGEKRAQGERAMCLKKNQRPEKSTSPDQRTEVTIKSIKHHQKEGW